MSQEARPIHYVLAIGGAIVIFGGGLLFPRPLNHWFLGGCVLASLVYQGYRRYLSHRHGE